MKQLVLLFIAVLALLLMPVYAQASDTDGSASHVTITVVMPNVPPGQKAEPTPFPALPEFPQSEPAPAPVIPLLYPTGVHEILENGVRWIVRVYELGVGENPAHIPRDNFERGGWRYSITDITKKETAAADVKAHTETVTINTDTKEMEAILRQLAPTMEFVSEDGYTGILTLDVSSIIVETAGTRTSNYTASATREYPHLSANDTSLVPKTITDGGRTLTLASVDWKTNYTMTVDYQQIPASYTAVATYSANASRTVVTGYTTTAEYKGDVSRLNQGNTVYTAYFMGAEILPERIPLEIIDPAPKETPAPSPDTDIEPEDEPGAEPEPIGGEEREDGERNPLTIIIPAALFALLIGIGAGHYIPRILKNKKVGNC